MGKNLVILCQLAGIGKVVAEDPMGTVFGMGVWGLDPVSKPAGGTVSITVM